MPEMKARPNSTELALQRLRVLEDCAMILDRLEKRLSFSSQPNVSGLAEKVRRERDARIDAARRRMHERHMYWTDASGMVLAVSDELCAALKRPERAMLDVRWAEMVHPDDRRIVVPSFFAAVASNSEWRSRHRLKCGDDRYRLVEAVSMPVFDAFGCYAGGEGTVSLL